jgi:hypothetical protein
LKPRLERHEVRLRGLPGAGSTEVDDALG